MSQFLSSRINQLFRNLLINGDQSIAQRIGDLGSRNISGTAQFAADRFKVTHFGMSGSIDVSHISSSPGRVLTGYEGNRAVRIDVNTADSSLGTGSSCGIVQPVEGKTFQSFSAKGKELFVLFFARANQQFNLSHALRNNDTGSGSPDYAYVTPVTIGTDWTRVAIKVPPHLSSPTHIGTGTALESQLTLAAGSNPSTSNLNVWTPENVVGSDTQDNFLASTSNWIEFTQAGLYVADSFNTDMINNFDFLPHSFLIGEERRAMQRYFQIFNFATSGSSDGSINNHKFHKTLPVEMRTSPTLIRTNIIETDNIQSEAVVVETGTSGLMFFLGTLSTDYRRRSEWTAEAEL